MKLVLIDKQIDIILKALENYSSETDKKQLLYATYESILEQKISSNAVIKPTSKCNENVI